MTTSNKNPSELFPGTTWESYGQGRTVVGEGTGTDASGVSKTFNISENTTNSGNNGYYDEIIGSHTHSLAGTGAGTTSGGAHTHTLSGEASTSVTHTHTIATNGIEVEITGDEEDRRIKTHTPNINAKVGEEYEEGKEYGEHVHGVTGTGGNSQQYSKTSSTESQTHTHTIAAQTATLLGSGQHTHIYSDRSLIYYNYDTVNLGVGEVEVKAATSGSYYAPSQTNTSIDYYGGPRTPPSAGAHVHKVIIPAHTTGAISQTHNHTVTIADGDLEFAVNGFTTTEQFSGATNHRHTATIPQLMSTNSKDITVSSAGNHTHTITNQTIANSGVHTHSLTGNTTIVGESVVSKNLQPYITVYMWKRLS